MNAVVRTTTVDLLIEKVRYLLKPGEVKLGNIPPWLVRRLRAYRKTQELDILPVSMLLPQSVHDISSQSTWLDHWGTSTVGPFTCCGKRPVLVSEPYSFGKNDAADLDKFSHVLGGLDWHVSSNAYWYPGRTVRITIHEPNQ